MTALIKGLPGNGTYSRYAPCGAITRPMLLHHSLGHDQDFLEDKRTQQAVVIGLYPLVPWRNIRGMRNRIAHGYFETDFSIVWDTVQQALPELLEALS